VIVTEAFPDLLQSALLVAVTVATVEEVTDGASNRPPLLMLPADADQVTAGLEVFDTIAANCTVPFEGIVMLGGDTTTMIGFEDVTVISKALALPEFLESVT